MALEDARGKQCFQCIACPNSRPIHSYSLKARHARSKVHQQFAGVWLAQQIRAIDRLSRVAAAEAIREREASSTENSPMANAPEVESDEDRSDDLDDPQRVLDDLWHHPRANLFGSPLGSAPSSQHDEDEILARRADEDALTDEQESEGNDDAHADRELETETLEAAGDLWYPFRKKMVRTLCLSKLTSDGDRRPVTNCLLCCVVL